MSEQWIASVVGKMHINRVSQKDIAMQMNVTPEYVSAILNGHRSPAGAQQRFEKAVADIIAERKEATRHAP